ncbi:hypothetical protein GH865_10895 [Rhodocyclus tenuis]|uniref:hypothetical protein n=1 Tax=Rhodocyclus gracilis TaxID=2929842 RepID=UPI001298C550|nr:hypothetical protein [Rhodocyclus gracilis]MRD73752.1 hypothetical protein [Rhodocyclus gracilis]
MRNKYFVAAVLSISLIVAGCSNKNPSESADTKKMDAWLQKGANEPVQRTWETGKPLVWGDEGQKKKNQ